MLKDHLNANEVPKETTPMNYLNLCERVAQKIIFPIELKLE